jgi:predicted transcriptional regulator of viral defense system
MYPLRTYVMKLEKELELYQIAEDQAGYFSLQQAKQIGLQRSQIYRDIERGKFIRTGYGVYRFVQFPASAFEEIHQAVLSAGRDVVVGFQSALYVYELSDIIPDEIHLILSPTASRRRDGIRVHTIQLEPDDITSFEGLPITTVAKSIVDCAFANIGDEEVRLAILQSLRRGMTTKEKLIQESKKRSARIQRLISQSVEGIKL